MLMSCAYVSCELSVCLACYKDAVKLNDRLQMLLSDDEKRAFQEAADKLNMSLSAWIRHVCRERLGLNFSRTDATA